MDGVLSLHELMHYTHVKKQVSFIFKIDFEKAYGKVNWDFLLICFKTGGFPDHFCGDPAYHCMCSMQVVDITLMKHRLTSITSIRVVQQKHRRSMICL
jgi:hypothetical protein